MPKLQTLAVVQHMSAHQSQSSSNDDRYFIGLLRDNGEKYLYIFNDESMPKACQAITSDAMDPELSLSWFEASCLMRQIRKIQEGTSNARGDDLPEFPDLDSF